MHRYTLAQLRAYTAAAAQDERTRLADIALGARVAFGADAAGWQMYRNAMTGAQKLPTTKESTTDG